MIMARTVILVVMILFEPVPVTVAPCPLPVGRRRRRVRDRDRDGPRARPGGDGGAPPAAPPGTRRVTVSGRSAPPGPAVSTKPYRITYVF